MIRTDFAVGTHGFLDWLTAMGHNFSYLVGFPIHGAVADILPLVPQQPCIWRPQRRNHNCCLSGRNASRH